MKQIYIQNRENIIKKTEEGIIVIFPRGEDSKNKFHGFFRLGKYETLIFDSFNEKNTLLDILNLLKLKLSTDNKYKKKSEEDLSKILLNFVNKLKGRNLIEEVSQKLEMRR